MQSVFGMPIIGGIYNYPGYEAGLAQAKRAIEAQRDYVNALRQSEPTDFLSMLMMANYRPPNPVPWEQRYADFCKRLSAKLGRESE